MKRHSNSATAALGVALLAAVLVVLLCLLVFLKLGWFSVICVFLSYFFMSIMFPTIFSLSIKDLGPQVKLGSSLVIMAIVGGAALPPLTGLLPLTDALLVPLVSFVVIGYFGWQGYKVKSV